MTGMDIESLPGAAGFEPLRAQSPLSSFVCLSAFLRILSDLSGSKAFKAAAPQIGVEFNATRA